MTDPQRFLQPLGWDRGFTYPQLGTIYTHADGSSLIHAVLNGMWTPYQSSRPVTSDDRDGISFRTTEDRIIFVRKQLRPVLAQYLASPDDSHLPIGAVPESKSEAKGEAKREVKTSVRTVYEALSGGSVAQVGKFKSSQSLEAIQAQIGGSGQLEGDIILELLIRAFRVNIFILHSLQQTVIATGSLIPSVRIPDVGAVVVLYRPGVPMGHYELLGLPGPSGQLDVHFALTHPLIQEILQYQNF